MPEVVRLGRKNIVEQLHGFSRASHAASTRARFALAAVKPGAISIARRSKFSASRQRPIRAASSASMRMAEASNGFLEVRLEQAFGDVEAVLVQGDRCFDQARVPMTARG